MGTDPHGKDEHDYIESENAVLYEDDERVIYVVKKECQNGDCKDTTNR